MNENIAQSCCFNRSGVAHCTVARDADFGDVLFVAQVECVTISLVSIVVRIVAVSCVDIDDVDASLTVASINGESTSVGAPVAVTLSYIDADGVEQTQDVNLTVAADGSYAIDSFDF